MKYQILMFLLVAFCVSCSKDPQTSDKQSDEFVKFFGSTGMDSSAQVLAVDGGYLMLGSERDGSAFKACIYKTDTKGNQLSRTVFCDSLSLVASDIIASQDGGYWICGNTPVLTDSATKKYETDVFIAILSADFKAKKISVFRLPANQYANAIAQDAEGNVYLAGSDYSDAQASASQCLVMKFNAEGDSIWKNTDLGASLNDVANDIAILNGSIYIVANSESHKLANQSKSNIVLFKIDSWGVCQDMAPYGGLNNDYGYCIKSFGGKLYVSGSIFSDNEYLDGWLACFSGDLHNPVWTATTQMRGYDELLSLSVNEQGIIASGYSTDESLRTKNMYITRFSLDGSLLNQFQSGGNDNEIARSVAFASDGQPVVTGTMYADADAVLFMLKTKL